MKKTILLLSLISLVAFGAIAQSFEIYDHEDNLLNGETLIVATEVSTPEHVLEIKVKNVDGSQITAKITYTLLTTQIDGTLASMCNPTSANTATGYCGQPWLLNTAPFILDPSETSDYGSVHFTQGANGGITTIQYKVYDIDNIADFNTFTITYSTLTAVELASVNSFNVYPNPAVDNFTIVNEFGANSYVEIYNVLGKVVRTVKADSNTVQIDCSKWQSGYYFCRLYNDGKVEKTIKMVVTN